MNKPSIPKGTRDFSPLEMSKRNYIFDTIRSVFALYGFKQIETPAMETLQTLLGKYGEEGDKLLFKVLNSGDYLSKIDRKELVNGNPLHLASIYTSFLNEGNMVKPYLTYEEEAAGEIWIENAFTKENVEEIMQGVEGVVNNPEGTGYAAHRDDILLAGKTGTAELKATKEDTSGKEIGWFSVFTAEENVDKPILLISMVENVKGIGGSGYVVRKDATVLDEYFKE